MPAESSHVCAASVQGELTVSNRWKYAFACGMKLPRVHVQRAQWFQFSLHLSKQVPEAADNATEMNATQTFTPAAPTTPAAFCGGRRDSRADGAQHPQRGHHVHGRVSQPYAVVGRVRYSAGGHRVQVRNLLAGIVQPHAGVFSDELTMLGSCLLQLLQASLGSGRALPHHGIHILH